MGHNSRSGSGLITHCSVWFSAIRLHYLHFRTGFNVNKCFLWCYFVRSARLWSKTNHQSFSLFNRLLECTFDFRTALLILNFKAYQHTLFLMVPQSYNHSSTKEIAHTNNERQDPLISVSLGRSAACLCLIPLHARKVIFKIANSRGDAFIITLAKYIEG